MKKLLIMLMVVAMAAFLFVGCMPGVTPDVDDEEDEDEEPVVPTTSIAITSVSDFSITSTSTLYVNKTEAANGLIVSGNAATLAEVKVYIDGEVCAATANVSDAGTWTLGVTKTELGADGEEKTLYAVASEAGLADATSLVYTFVKDTVAPGITEVKANAAKAEELPDSVPLGTNPISSFAMTTTTLVTGTWTVNCLADIDSPSNVKITSPTGTPTTYTVWPSATDADQVLTDAIPGVKLTFIDFVKDNAVAVIVKSTTGPKIVDRATLEFDEDVTTATAIAGTYTLTNLTTGATGAFPATLTFKSSNNTVYWDTFTGALARYDDIRFSAAGVKDLAGNAISATSPATATCTVGAASATGLKP